MPPSRYKISRKELKQPDEFRTIVESAQDFLLGNLRQVIVSAIVVLVAAGIAFGTYTYERARDRAAGDAFYSALSALSAKQYQTAEDAFSKLAAAEPNRRIGKLARFYLAQAFFGAGDMLKARDALIAFVADFHDPAFSSIAMMDLGVVYERMGDLAKAQGAYQQAAGVPGPEQSSAMLAYARILAERGDKEGAIRSYRAFLSARPYSRRRGEVFESLAALGAGPHPAAPQSPSAAASAGAMPVMMAPAPGAMSAPSNVSSPASSPAQSK